jgi:hypothetical protein
VLGNLTLAKAQEISALALDTYERANTRQLREVREMRKSMRALARRRRELGARS